MTANYFMLYGVPCGRCGLPAHHIEVYPNGVRTAHIDWRKRPCDLTRSRTQTTGPARFGIADPQGDPAPVWSLQQTERTVL